MGPSTPGQGSVFSVTFPVFSLPKLLAPAFSEDLPSERPITLVLTEMGSETGWLSNEERVGQCRGIRERLRGILYSDFDILLPKMDMAGPKELFFIAGSLQTKLVARPLPAASEMTWTVSLVSSKPV